MVFWGFSDGSTYHHLETVSARLHETAVTQVLQAPATIGHGPWQQDAALLAPCLPYSASSAIGADLEVVRKYNYQ